MKTQNKIKEFVNIIKERGFVHQTTDLNNLEESYNKIVGYTGLTAHQIHYM